MRYLFLLLLLGGCAHADKAMHAGAGAGICLVTYDLMSPKYRDFAPLVGITAAGIVAVAKELSDAKPDGWDAAATVGGAGFACLRKEF